MTEHRIGMISQSKFQTFHTVISGWLQINSQTGVMDMSVTYGISDAEVRTLRTGSGGLLKVTNDHRTSNQEYPLIISGPICPFGGVHRKPQGDCFIAGFFFPTYFPLKTNPSH